MALSGNAPPASGPLGIATPLHAALGLTDLTPLDPTQIPLSDEESRALCEAADAHLSAEGVRLTFVNAHMWTVTCAREIDALTERPDWLIGEPLRPNLPRGIGARLLERWMNELQMLLFAHPVNAAREERGLPPINIVWLWGFGSLNVEKTEDVTATVGAARRDTHPLSTPTSRQAAPTKAGSWAGNSPSLEHLHALRNGKVTVWQNAWQTRSSEILSANSILLGDSHPRLRLTPRKPSTASNFTALFQRKPTLEAVLATLQQQL